MAQQYIYAVSGIKYGTPTGSTTMPGTGALVALPNTVKGSITIEETEGTVTKFFVDQKKDPIRAIKTDEGEMSVVAQFYDLNPIHLANLKGGTPVTGATESFTPSADYTNVEKAIEITFSSGHKMNIYNGSIVARMIGEGGRDAMIRWEVKITPQVTADSGAAYNLTTS